MAIVEAHIRDQGGQVFRRALTYRPLRRLRNLTPQVTGNLSGTDLSIKVRHAVTVGRYLGLEDIDFGGSPSHVGAIGVDRTWMGFTLTGAPAQPLARQVRQNTAIAGIAALERGLGGTVAGLIL